MSESVLKLTRPDTSKPGFVRMALRPRLEIERPRLELPTGFGDGGIHVVSLVAPAGYGKSTIAGRWREQLRACGVACAWLSLQPKHRDAKTLLVDLLAQLHQHLGSAARIGVQRMLQGATSTTVEPVLAAVMSGLEPGSGRLVLILDDLEQLQDSAGEALVRSLLAHRPPFMDLMLCSRVADQFPLSRARIAGRLIDLRAMELAFTTREISDFLLAYLGTQCPDDMVETLSAKTEGWPAAIGLFAQVAERNGLAQALACLDGQTLELAEYLNDVVLSTLPDALQMLMMRAAVPDRFGLELLGLLVPGQAAALTLAQLQAATPFLQVIQGEQTEYRFHSLCAAHLRRRLFREQPALHGDLLAIAGDWCWNNGKLHEAINCARAAGQWSLMAQRLAAVADHMVRAAGEFDAYLSWIRDLPAAALAERPELLLHQAWALCFKREMAQAEIALSRLEAILPNVPTDVADGLWRRSTLHRSMIQSIRDRSHEELQTIQQWLVRYPDAPPNELGQAYCVLASAARNTHQHELALRAIQRADTVFRAVGGDYSLSWVHNIRLATLIKSGRFTEAAAVGAKSLQVISETLGERSTAAAMSHAMLGYLAYERGDTEEASCHLDLALPFMANQGVVDPLYYAYLTHSWMAADEGNEQSALDLLLEGEQLGMQLDLPRLTNQLATRRAIQLLHAGDQLAADAVIRERSLLNVSVNAAHGTDDRSAELLQLNLELLRGRFCEAASRAKLLSRKAAATGGLRMRAEYDFLWVVALHGRGDEKEAARRLRIVLAEASEHRRYRFMLHHGRIAEAVVSSLWASREAVWAVGGRRDAADSMLEVIAQHFGVGGHDDPPPSRRECVEGLTDREAEILTRAARTGLSNRQLAQALFVSEGTLKWHLHNIYVKLEVKNRTGAIARAQRLGLLSL